MKCRLLGKTSRFAYQHSLCGPGVLVCDAHINQFVDYVLINSYIAPYTVNLVNGNAPDAAPLNTLAYNSDATSLTWTANQTVGNDQHQTVVLDSWLT
jgi:hypothetical protein